ncbi:MAG: PepSY domain-containing protein [Verrucomicrobia bacterium]|nr:PepSY domain-containing protein [Verrucomicrobiota bacterium]
MPSSDATTLDASLASTLRAWNRRLHFYLGLYFLFFIWLFALTGLLINHHEWKFAEFWPNRKVANTEQAIQLPAAETNLAKARDVMRQLSLTGEIQWVTTRPDPNRFDFRVARPGTNIEVQVDLKTARAKLQRTELNSWGILHTLHTFTGVRIGDAQNQRDWLLTTLWALAMDAVAAGLSVMVLSSLAMWWVLPGKKLGGALALAAGTIMCGWFLVGLRLIAS